jgi:NADH-quinone oxidoreductase subunit E
VSAVPRFGHGSRVPGWDEAVDLSKDPAVIPDLANTTVPDALREAIVTAMAKYPDRRSAVIPALHAAQDLHGWCSPEAIQQVAAVMQVTPAYLSSVATFYDMLETEPRVGGSSVGGSSVGGSSVGGPSFHDVYVCTNISCSLRGADELYEAMIAAAADREDVRVRSFECLGACDIAPMASVDGEYVGPLQASDAEQIMADLKEGRPVLEAKQLRYRKCADPGVTAGAEEFGPAPDTPRADTAGLTDEPDRPGPTAPVEVPVDEMETE